jgi:anaerobic selenocysteine-containing dehydrogenase
VNRFLDRVYSPERILHPLVRVGPKGDALFEPVSWDDALDRVAHDVKRIVAEWGGEAVLPWWDAGTTLTDWGGGVAYSDTLVQVARAD